jgi:hypothetical protein
MFAHHSSSCRFAAAALALAGMGAAVSAADRVLPFWGSFTCQAEATFGPLTVIDLPDPVPDIVFPSTIDVVIAAGGCVSYMQGPVASYAKDEHIDFWFDPELQQVLNLGSLTSVMRDATGATIVMKMEMYIDPPTAEHPNVFHGTYTIIGGTGRFAGAGGKGIWSGWASDNDDPPAVAGMTPSALGHYEFRGCLTLPIRHHRTCAGSN